MQCLRGGARGTTSAYTAALAAHPETLVRNPGFEAGTACWIDWGNPSASTAEAHEGVHGLQVGPGEGGRFQTFAVQPSTRYRMEVWAKLEKPTASDPTGAAWVGVAGERGAGREVKFDRQVLGSEYRKYVMTSRFQMHSQHGFGAGKRRVTPNFTWTTTEFSGSALARIVIIHPLVVGYCWFCRVIRSVAVSSPLFSRRILSVSPGSIRSVQSVVPFLVVGYCRFRRVIRSVAVSSPFFRCRVLSVLPRAIRSMAVSSLLF